MTGRYGVWQHTKDGDELIALVDAKDAGPVAAIVRKAQNQMVRALLMLGLSVFVVPVLGVEPRHDACGHRVAVIGGAVNGGLSACIGRGALFVFEKLF